MDGISTWQRLREFCLDNYPDRAAMVNELLEFACCVAAGAECRPFDRDRVIDRAEFLRYCAENYDRAQIND
jgi:hypothetical protein